MIQLANCPCCEGYPPSGISKGHVVACSKVPIRMREGQLSLLANWDG